MKIEFDGNKVKIRVNRSRDIGMSALGEQALKDANFFCKQDSGALIDNSKTESQLIPDASGTIRLIWNTPYAKRQYYTGQPSPDKNANASMMWAHKGEEANKETHLAILQKAAREG